MADLNTTDFSLPAKNHNNPPSDVEFLGENLTLRHVHIIRAAETHLGIAAQMPDHFMEQNEASYTSDFIKLMQNCIKELERRRKEEKEPFLRQGQYVDTFFGEFQQKLEAAIEKSTRPLKDWLQRQAAAEQEERERAALDIREQQEAALRVAVEAAGIERPAAVEHAVNLTQQVKAADAMAAAPVISMAATVTKTSSARLAMKWVGLIKDVDQLDLNKLRPYIAGAELQKALDRYVKQGGRQCDGAEIKEEIDAKVK